MSNLKKPTSHVDIIRGSEWDCFRAIATFKLWNRMDVKFMDAPQQSEGAIDAGSRAHQRAPAVVNGPMNTEVVLSNEQSSELCALQQKAASSIGAMAVLGQRIVEADIDAMKARIKEEVPVFGVGDQTANDRLAAPYAPEIVCAHFAPKKQGICQIRLHRKYAEYERRDRHLSHSTPTAYCQLRLLTLLS